MNTSRQLALYLGVEIPDSLPDGEYRQPEYVSPSYGEGPADRDPEDAENSAARNNSRLRLRSLNRMTARCTAGSAVEAIAEELPPLYMAPGESMPDGRTGRDAILEAIVESWPTMPENGYMHGYDFSIALGQRKWLTQGEDWEYVVPNAKAVYEALCSGQTAEEVRASVRSGNPQLVSEHRAARDRQE